MDTWLIEMNMTVPDKDITTNYRFKLASKSVREKNHLLEFNKFD